MIGVGALRVDRLCGRPGPLRSGDRTLLAARCYVADRAIARLVGLLGTRRLEPDEALVIPRCASVHTVGMRAAIDVAFLDERRVVMCVVTLRPMRVARARGARFAVEAPAGSLTRLAAGSRLRFDEVRS